MSKKQFEKIEKLLPIARKPAKITNRVFFERTAIYDRKRMQMEGITEKVWKLAYNLHEI